MSIHWNRFYKGTYLSWYLPQCQDAENHHCSQELSPLRQEVSKVLTYSLLVFNDLTLEDLLTSTLNFRSGMRRDTPTSLPTSHRASVSKKVIMSSLASAGHCQRRWGLMCWRLSQQARLPLQRRHSLECKSFEVLLLWFWFWNVFCWSLWLPLTL